MTDKIWLENYPNYVSKEIDPNAYASLVELFEKSCTEFSDKPAISNYGSTLTYAELNKKSHDFAAYLQNELGLKKGDRIGIMLPNVLQYYVALFGALRAGVVVVNINPLYTPRELEQELTDSDVQAIVVMSSFAKNLEDALTQFPGIRKVIVTELEDLFPPLKAWMTHIVLKYIKKMIPNYKIPNAISFKKVLAIGKNLSLQTVPLTHEDLAFLQFTGGTTGIPKAAMLTHGNIVSNIEQNVAWVEKSLRRGEEVFIAPLPLYHIYSLTACAFCFLKLGGLTVLITNPRDIDNFVKELSRLNYSVFIGINTLFNALLNHSDFNQLSFKNLRLTITGGMPLQRNVADRWRQLTGNIIIEGYGLTEASPVIALNPLNISDYTGSIGMPLPSTDVAIQDDEGHDVPLGDVGEICVKGPQVMKQYWHNEEETRKIFTKDGWLRTGDLAYMDNKGFIYIVDRKKDMILVSGFNVYPSEIEEVISSHAGVAEVAVIGVPYEPSGEAIKAFVVRKSLSLTEEELMAFCRERLTGYKIPKFIEFRDYLPKSNVGKILRRKLREKD